MLRSGCAAVQRLPGSIATYSKTKIWNCAIMIKVNSASSNNSGASSETSESQSVEENAVLVGATPQTFDTNSRGIKNWKRMKEHASPVKDKEGDTKRPPWRAVSVSTLPKPDKSALLRAKLLDASRRLRAGRSSVGVQTDLTTKLIKKADAGMQTDLIIQKDAEILTDGSYRKKKDSTSEFILTYSIPQMTDAIAVSNVCTQTLLPKVPGDDFIQAYIAGDQNPKNINQLTGIEKALLHQICKIREGNKLTIMEEHSGSSAMLNRPFTSNAFVPSDRHCSVPSAAQGRSLLKPTMSSWHFEYGEIGSELNASFTPYIIQPNRPWCSFVPMFSSVRNRVDREGMEYGWNLLLLSIDELIQESNRLADIIEDAVTPRFNFEHSALRSVQNVGNFSSVVFPSEHWLPIIEKQENELSEMMKDLEYTGP